MSVINIQNEISEYIISGNLKPKLRQHLIEYSEEEFESRLSIYRNNFFCAYIDVLEGLYPNIVDIVGSDFFKATVKVYLSTSPQNHPAMVEVGSTFPEFLTHFEHTQQLSYLPDMARLDLYQHQAYHSDDQTPLTGEEFTHASEYLAASKVQFHPSVRLLKSNYAVFDIWQLNQGESNDKLENPNQTQSLLIFRPHYEVITQLLEANLFLFLKLLYEGVNLSEAIETTLEADSAFNPAGAIEFLIKSQTIIKILEATP